MRIERNVSGVITCPVSPGSAPVEPETFKGQELKIVQALEEVDECQILYIWTP